MIGWLAGLRHRPPMQLDGRLTDLFAVAAVALVPLSAALHVVLPPRFSYDSETLRRIATGEYTPLEDTSYLYVGRLYRVLGMADRPWAAMVFGLALAAVALYWALVRARGVASPPVYALVGLYVLTASVYLGQYSKDVWALAVVLVVLLAGPGWRGELAVITVTVAYASFLRSYWFLILAVYLGLRLLTRSALRRRRVLLGVAAVVAGVTLLYPLVAGTDIQSVRDSVNLDRVLSADAATAIAPPQLGLGPLGDVVENGVTLAELLVPLPLLTEGSPVYAVYFLGIGLVWWMYARVVFTGPDRLLDGRPAAAADLRSVRAALFALAVVTTQGFFEPDYGSYLRHLTPVLPLVIAVAVGNARSRFLAPVGAADGRTDTDRPLVGADPSERDGAPGGRRG